MVSRAPLSQWSCQTPEANLTFSTSWIHQVPYFDWMFFLLTARGLCLKNDVKFQKNVNLCVSLKGHVNFSDEVTSSIRISDGVVLFIDAAEGVSNLYFLLLLFPLLFLLV